MPSSVASSACTPRTKELKSLRKKRLAYFELKFLETEHCKDTAAPSEAIKHSVISQDATERLKYDQALVNPEQCKKSDPGRDLSYRNGRRPLSNRSMTNSLHASLKKPENRKNETSKQKLSRPDSHISVEASLNLEDSLETRHLPKRQTNVTDPLVNEADGTTVRGTSYNFLQSCKNIGAKNGSVRDVYSSYADDGRDLSMKYQQEMDPHKTYFNNKDSQNVVEQADISNGAPSTNSSTNNLSVVQVGDSRMFKNSRSDDIMTLSLPAQYSYELSYDENRSNLVEDERCSIDKRTYLVSESGGSYSDSIQANKSLQDSQQIQQSNNSSDTVVAKISSSISRSVIENSQNENDTERMCDKSDYISEKPSYSKESSARSQEMYDKNWTGREEDRVQESYKHSSEISPVENLNHIRKPTVSAAESVKSSSRSSSRTSRSVGPVLESLLGKERMARLVSNLEYIDSVYAEGYEEELNTSDQCVNGTQKYPISEPNSNSIFAPFTLVDRHSVDTTLEDGREELTEDLNRNMERISSCDVTDNQNTDHINSKINLSEENFLKFQSSNIGSHFVDKLTPMESLEMPTITSSHKTLERVEEMMKNSDSLRQSKILFNGVCTSNKKLGLSKVTSTKKDVQCAYSAEEIYEAAGRHHMQSSLATSNQLKSFDKCKHCILEPTELNHSIQLSPKVNKVLDFIDVISNDFEKLCKQSEQEEGQSSLNISSNRSEFGRKVAQIKQDIIESIMNNDDDLFIQVTSDIKNLEHDVEKLRYSDISDVSSSASRPLSDYADSDIQLAWAFKDTNKSISKNHTENNSTEISKPVSKPISENLEICSKSCNQILDDLFDSGRRQCGDVGNVYSSDEIGSNIIKGLIRHQGNSGYDLPKLSNCPAPVADSTDYEKPNTSGNFTARSKARARRSVQSHVQNISRAGDRNDDICWTDMRDTKKENNDNKTYEYNDDVDRVSTIINEGSRTNYSTAAVENKNDGITRDDSTDDCRHSRDAHLSLPSYLRDALSIAITDSIDMSATTRMKNRKQDQATRNADESLTFNYDDGAWRPVDELVPEFVRADLHLDLRASSDVASSYAVADKQQNITSQVLCADKHLNNDKQAGANNYEVFMQPVLKKYDSRQTNANKNSVRLPSESNKNRADKSNALKSYRSAQNSTVRSTRRAGSTSKQHAKLVEHRDDRNVSVLREDARRDSESIPQQSTAKCVTIAEILKGPTQSGSEPKSAQSGSGVKLNQTCGGRIVKSVCHAWGECEEKLPKSSENEKLTRTMTSARPPKLRPWSAKSSSKLNTRWRSAAPNWSRGGQGEGPERVSLSPWQRSLSARPDKSGDLLNSTTENTGRLEQINQTGRGSAPDESSVIVCLPDEILLRVFKSGLSYCDLLSCARVCWRFNHLAMDPSVWKKIKIRKKSLTDESLAAIGRRHPVSLDLVECRGDHVTSEGLRELFRQCADTLQELSFRGCSNGKLTGDDIVLHAFSRCRHITNLDASFTNVNDNGINSIAECIDSHLERLSLEGCPNISSSALHNIITKQDSRPFFGGLLIEGRGTLKVGRMQELVNRLTACELHSCLLSLDISGLMCVTADTTRLISSYCSRLTHLRLAQCWKVTDVCLAEMSAGLKHLLTLDVQACKQIKDHAVTQIVRRCSSLRTLNLSHCPLITDVSLVEMSSHCTNLRYLDVSHCMKVGNVGLKALLSSCHHLELLDLSHTAVNNRGVSAVSRSVCAHSLHTLNLSHCRQVSLESLRPLISSCTRLRRLGLHGNAGLLLDLSQLTSLNRRLTIDM